MIGKIFSVLNLLGQWHRILLDNSAVYRGIARVVANFIAHGRWSVDPGDDHHREIY